MRDRLTLSTLGPLAALFALILLGAGLNENFLSAANVTNVLARSAFIGMIAVGMTFVITSGGLDLSVGSMAAFVAGMMILAMNALQPSLGVGLPLALAGIVPADHGLIELEVLEVFPKTLKAKVIYGGLLKNRKGMNLPGVSLPVDALTEKDKADLEFGLANNVDYIALSFVRHGKDIRQLRELIDNHKSKAKIVAKIEMLEALLDALSTFINELLCPIQNLLDKYLNTDSFALPCRISYNVPVISGIENYLAKYKLSLECLKAQCMSINKDANWLKHQATLLPGSLSLKVTSSINCSES